MGKATVYCEGCGIRITEKEFKEGNALTYKNMSFCEGCGSDLKKELKKEGKKLQEMTESSVLRALDIEADEDSDPDPSPDKPPSASTEPVSDASPSGQKTHGNNRRKKKKKSRKRPERGRRERGTSTSDDDHDRLEKFREGREDDSFLSTGVLVGGGAILVLGLIAGMFYFLSGSEGNPALVDARIKKVRNEMSALKDSYSQTDVKRMSEWMSEAREAAPEGYRTGDLAELNDRLEEMQQNLSKREELRNRVSSLKESIPEQSPGKLKETMKTLFEIQKKGQRNEMGEEFQYTIGEAIKDAAGRWRDQKMDELPELDTSSIDAFVKSYREHTEQLDRIIRKLKAGLNLPPDKVNEVDASFWRKDLARKAEQEKWKFENKSDDFIHGKFEEISKRLDNYLSNVREKKTSGNLKEALRMLENPPREMKRTLKQFTRRLSSGDSPYDKAMDKMDEIDKKIEMRKKEIKRLIRAEETGGQDTAESGDEGQQPAPDQNGDQPDENENVFTLFKDGKGTDDMVWRKPKSGKMEVKNGNLVLSDSKNREMSEDPYHYLFMGKDGWKNYIITLSFAKIEAKGATFYFRSDHSGNGAFYHANLPEKAGTIVLKTEDGKIFWKKGPDNWVNISEKLGENARTDRDSGKFGMSLIGSGKIVLKEIKAKLLK